MHHMPDVLTTETSTSVTSNATRSRARSSTKGHSSKIRPSTSVGLCSNFDDVNEVCEALFIQALAEGTLPSAWVREHATALNTKDLPALDLINYLPKNVAVLRTVADRGSLEMLASGPDFLVRLYLYSNTIRISVAATDELRAQQIGNDIRSHLPKPVTVTTDPEIIPIMTWSNSSYGAETSRSTLRGPAWAEVSKNYTSETRKKLENLMNLSLASVPDHSGRLLIFAGCPGTGKTRAIRTLAREWSAQAAFESIDDPEVAFSKASYFREISRLRPNPSDSQTHRIVVVEDADHFLNVGSGGPDIGRLLNAVDGFAGNEQLLFILTTNLDEAHIAPALTRPGRCLGLIPFGLLTPLEAKAIMPEGALTPHTPLTLAQVFDQQVEGTSFHEETDTFSPPGYL